MRAHDRVTRPRAGRSRPSSASSPPATIDVTGRGAVDGVTVRDVTPAADRAARPGAVARRPTSRMQARVGRTRRRLRVARRRRTPASRWRPRAVDHGHGRSTQAAQGMASRRGPRARPQWFGDSVAPYEWSDIWLNEGHATWYEIQRRQEHGELAGQRGVGGGLADVESCMRAAYPRRQLPRAVRPGRGPAGRHADAAVQPERVRGGALVLYACARRSARDVRRARARVGEAYRDGVARTADSRPRLEGRRPRPRPIPAAWLPDATTPAMPGRPAGRSTRSRRRQSGARRRSDEPRPAGRAAVGGTRPRQLGRRHGIDVPSPPRRADPPPATAPAGSPPNALVAAERPGRPHPLRSDHGRIGRSAGPARRSAPARPRSGFATGSVAGAGSASVRVRWTTTVSARA